MNICVFCSSSKVSQAFFKSAEELGKLIGDRKDTLVYGGTKTGLMGVIADSVKQNGGRVIGVIPAALKEKGLGYENADSLLETENMRERKALMGENAEAFIALPGGFGTLEEILEVITLKQLGFHNKPVIFINTDNFYKYLIEQFNQIFRENFSKPEFRDLYYIAGNPTEALEYIDRYTPKTFPWKL